MESVRRHLVSGVYNSGNRYYLRAGHPVYDKYQATAYKTYAIANNVANRVSRRGMDTKVVSVIITITEIKNE